ncbi:carboxy terminal-processing peptidase [Pseudomonadota bacterium]|jgi:carboxyl-terminal processing protease|nr:carboxy terminal-processing peptidase [Pseudomonadota bacterium]
MLNLNKILSLLIVFSTFEVFSSGEFNFKVNDENIILGKEIFENIADHHYSNKIEKQTFHVQYIDALIEELDPNKNLFFGYEVRKFQRMAEVFKPSRQNFFSLEDAFKIINIYFNRLLEVTDYQSQFIMTESFDFTLDENLDIYPDDNVYPKTRHELKQRWRKTTKNDFLISLLADTEEDNIKDSLLSRYSNRSKRILQRNVEDVFSLAMNTLTNQFDPHSSYMSPYNAEDFEIDMSLKLGGIGALLSTKDDYAIIVSLVPGGPAELSGELNEEDRIVKIRQENEEVFTDVTGWRIDEIVRNIRGEPQSKVELEIIPADSEDDTERKNVLITREIVELKEREAKSKIVNISRESKDYKIGIIDLPSFYIDFQAWQEKDPNYKSSSKDVKKILSQFNADDVDAVILDLRNNSGGALSEANKLTALFNAPGVALQIKEATGNVFPWGDGRVQQIWKKPMAVLVNRYSASASEIFAGAIQDYQRGLVIGQRTFGKGTVQRIENLSVGQMKITESKFYRITGDSTQSKGIEPDILLPTTRNLDDVGESALPTHLPWDKVKPTRYRMFPLDKNLLEVTKRNNLVRMQSDPNLIYLQDVRKRFDSQNEKKNLSLILNVRKQEQLERKEWYLTTENKRRSALGLASFETYEDLEAFNDTLELDDINTQSDYLLLESIEIISDFVSYGETQLFGQAK